jgi:hypothetical protein
MPDSDKPVSRFAAAPAPEPDPEQLVLREDAVRAALLTAGQNDFARIARTVRNDYSEQLEDTGARITRYMRREQGEGASATYMDPNQYTAGVALGMSDNEVTRALLQQQGVAIPDDKTVNNISEAMRASYRFPFSSGNGSDTTETQNPRANGIDYYTNKPNVCVIVPPSAYYPSILQIPGMTREQNLEFINLHESAHCRDTQNKFAGLDKAQIENFDTDKPETAIGNKDRLTALSIVNRQEAYADVSSIITMVRKGADPKIIDGLIEWRKDTGDVDHMSIAALQDLKRTIDTMGVKELRRMDDDKANELANTIAARNSPEPAVVEKIIQYTTGTAAERRDMLVLQRDNPDMQKAVEYLKAYNLPPPKDPTAKPTPPPAFTPLPPAEQAVFEQVRLYDAQQILQDRAFKDDKKITPETLIKAYRQEQKELMRELERKPGDPATQAKLEKLDESLVSITQSLDYIAVNAARGVDITKDRSLRDVDLPPLVKPAEGTPEVATGGSNFVARRPVMGM